MHLQWFKSTWSHWHPTQRYYHLSVSFRMTFPPQFNKVFFPQTQQCTHLSIPSPWSHMVILPLQPSWQISSYNPESPPPADTLPRLEKVSSAQHAQSSSPWWHNPDAWPTGWRPSNSISNPHPPLRFQPLSPHNPTSCLRPSTISVRIYSTWSSTPLCPSGIQHPFWGCRWGKYGNKAWLFVSTVPWCSMRERR